MSASRLEYQYEQRRHGNRGDVIDCAPGRELTRDEVAALERTFGHAGARQNIPLGTFPPKLTDEELAAWPEDRPPPLGYVRRRCS